MTTKATGGGDRRKRGQVEKLTKGAVRPETEREAELCLQAWELSAKNIMRMV